MCCTRASGSIASFYVHKGEQAIYVLMQLLRKWCNDLVQSLYQRVYYVCLCKSANGISLGEDMPNSSYKRTLMNCAKGVSLITIKNGCDYLFYVAKLKEIKDSNTDCRYSLHMK